MLTDFIASSLQQQAALPLSGSASTSVDSDCPALTGANPASHGIGISRGGTYNLPLTQPPESCNAPGAMQ